MGKVLSVASRKANRFNVENRAHRVLDLDKPQAAPKFESNIRDYQKVLEGKVAIISCTYQLRFKFTINR